MPARDNTYGARQPVLASPAVAIRCSPLWFANEAAANLRQLASLTVQLTCE